MERRNRFAQPAEKIRNSRIRAVAALVLGVPLSFCRAAEKRETAFRLGEVGRGGRLKAAYDDFARMKALYPKYALEALEASGMHANDVKAERRP